jgi:hypothetical protein
MITDEHVEIYNKLKAYHKFAKWVLGKKFDRHIGEYLAVLKGKMKADGLTSIEAYLEILSAAKKDPTAPMDMLVPMFSAALFELEGVQNAPQPTEAVSGGRA